MKHTKLLFEHRLTVLGHQLTEAALQKSPAVWLHENGGRTSVFYLEGMCRMLGAAHNDERFAKLNDKFKRLEDALGAFDYYDAWLKEFNANPQISDDVGMLCDHERDLAELKLNGLLKQEGWLPNKGQRLLKIKKQLKKIDWQSDKDFVKHARQFYQKNIEKLTQQLGQPMTDIEAHVHELRRDVRWLSIYPQAFKGFFALETARVTAKKFDKYLSAEVVNSPFNQLTQVSDIEPLLFHQNHFVAMSWLIAALGLLKDQGLRLEELSYALQTVEGLTDEEADAKAQSILGSGQASQAQLLSAAQSVAKTFKADAILSGLLVR
ncbi:hypothetical protein GCM10009007_13120 [Formosimonas limnophila]|uniref:Uncharacterized protein n=1 Tax=Formosimonas limnophila TaxID=1384487 RepID=A0A8J3CHT8_9BURK|nr:hypothetical protein [Formosimonas limnophila]GHA73496.1 hypothetical protein GCM10009007_13120 [Formosimonas limnophila]